MHLAFCQRRAHRYGKFCQEIPLSGLQSLREAHTRAVPRDNNKITDGGKHGDLELPGQGDAWQLTLLAQYSTP